MICKERSMLRIRVAAVAFMATVALVLLPLGSVVFAGQYNPCQLPVVVGSGVQPNVLIIQDMSGSMQSAAYYDSYLQSYYSNTYRGYQSAAPSALSALNGYQMTTGYYGSADSDTYYKYNATGDTNGAYFEEVPAATAPAKLYQFTADSAQGSSASEIKFTAAGNDFVVGDWVALYNLSSHLGMNGGAYPVVARSGDTFTVTANWNGTADTIAGQAIKRVVPGTSFATGVNGTVLNYLLTTRTDAAMKAFIGGRALHQDTDYYYLQYQGMRRYVVDENLGCLANIRPGDTNNPDNYTSGSYYGTDGSTSDRPKDMYMTVSNYWKGKLDSHNPGSARGGSGRKCQVYSFTLTSPATVTIRMFAANPTGDDWTTRVYLYNGATPTYSGYITYDSGTTNTTSSEYCAIITRTLSAGTYSIEATSYNNNTYKDYYLAATFEEDTNHPRGSNPDVTLVKDTTDAYHDGVLSVSTVGTILNAQCRIQQPKAKRAGVIQNSFNLVRFGFMYYNTTSGRQGKILVGCDNTDLDVLINAFSGIGTQTVNSKVIDFTDCYPYNGTPTGPALQIAYNYFSQTNKYSTGATNNAFYVYDTITDPYRGPGTDANGTLSKMICRNSFVLLVSDGEWNNGIDPVNPAHKMHTGDLRPGTDFPPVEIPTGSGATIKKEQTATVYTIFAFSNSESGIRAMKTVAMYGGFTDISGCGSTDYPYEETSLPSSSLSFTWPRSYCDPTVPLPSGHNYHETCCQEWDLVKTREGEPVDSQKGIPDNYFEASDGRQLERSLQAVLLQVLSGNASASAVATVSQQLSTGDTVVRGVFEAADETDPSQFLWYGHLEAYFTFKYKDPVTGEETYKYDFELPCNKGFRCEELHAGKATCPSGYDGPYCWDAAKFLNEMPTAERNVYTSDATFNPVTKRWDWTKVEFKTGTITPAMLGVGTPAQRDDLVSWTLGEVVSTMRDRTGTVDKSRQHRLGDIVYSTPVIGGPPSPGAVSSNDPNISEFYKFRNSTFTPSGCTGESCQKGTKPDYEILYRDKVVYVGGNDGMVHAFLMARWKEDTADPTKSLWQDHPSSLYSGDNTHSKIGTEIWAYIPRNMLKRLSALADQGYGKSGGAAGTCDHRAMVDLAPQVYTVFIPPPGTTKPREWRSVLVGGERGGGDTYFCLDVTDPWDMQVLWEYSVIKDRVVLDTSDPSDIKVYQPFESAYDHISNLPMSWTQPAVGRVQLPDIQYYVGSPDASYKVSASTDALDFDTSVGVEKDDQNRRHVVFVGGGLHLFDKDFETSTSTPEAPAQYGETLWNKFKADLLRPALIVIDVETGYNLFKYTWPTVLKAGDNSSVLAFPDTTRTGGLTTPYAMSDPVAIDIWDPALGSVSDDGFIDRVYMGDTTGLIYGIKFTSPTATHKGMLVDVWRTKTITDSDELDSNFYRWKREPISQSPSISFEAPVKGTTPYLRAIFAAGKYEDVVGAGDDRSDTRKTSLYNLRDSAELPVIPVSGGTPLEDVFGTGFEIQLAEHCKSSSFNPGGNACTWVRTDDSADCCESSCTDPCFACVYDLTRPVVTSGSSVPAERFVSKPLIAGGYVFATSFMPSSNPCDYTGTGYLYVFTYDCKRIPDNTVIVTVDPTTGMTVTDLYAGGGTSGSFIGVRVDLGVGMPSKPVLSSDMKNVIVQMSDGNLLKIPVTLAAKPVQVQGWQEK